MIKITVFYIYRKSHVTSQKAKFSTKFRKIREIRKTAAAARSKRIISASVSAFTNAAAGSKRIVSAAAKRIIGRCRTFRRLRAIFGRRRSWRRLFSSSGGGGGARLRNWRRTEWISNCGTAGSERIVILKQNYNIFSNPSNFFFNLQKFKKLFFCFCF